MSGRLKEVWEKVGKPLTPVFAAFVVGMIIPRFALASITFGISYYSLISGNRAMRRHSGSEQEIEDPGDHGGDES